jgi:hypothetical protein
MRTIVFVLLFFTQISSEKERALLKVEILENRYKNLLPSLMEDVNTVYVLELNTRVTIKERIRILELCLKKLVSLMAGFLNR